MDHMFERAYDVPIAAPMNVWRLGVSGVSLALCRFWFCIIYQIPLFLPHNDQVGMAKVLEKTAKEHHALLDPVRSS